MRRYSHNGVDVSIGVVANQIAMIEPHYALGMKKVEQLFLYIYPGERLVAVRRQQALACGKDGSLSIALYASTFEDKTCMVLEGSLKGSLIVELQVDGIVLLPGKLLAPSVESEVEQMNRND